MSMGMYAASVPMLLRSLTNLVGILQKAATHAEEHKINLDVLLSARLFPDMFALTRQVQIASDTAKGCVARLTGQEPPSWPDEEASFADLIERVQKTIAYVEQFTPAQIDGTEEQTVTLNLRSGPIHFSGENYLRFYVLPNLYFHITTTYAILRHNGVSLGKRDYLGAS